MPHPPTFLRSFLVRCATPCHRRSIPIAICPDGTLLVCTNNQLQVYDAQGSFLRKFAPAGERTGHLLFPTGVAVDDCHEEAIVTDLESRVQVFKLDGTFLRAWGQVGSVASMFCNPEGAAVYHRCKGECQVVVCDTDLNHRFQVFERNGSFVAEWPSIQKTTGFAVSAAGQVVCSDYWNDTIKIVDLHGNLQVSFGERGQFRKPRGVTFDPRVDHTDRLFVCDADNGRVQVLSLSPSGDIKVTTTFTVDDTRGQELCKPVAVCVDRLGRIFVAHWRSSGCYVHVCIFPEDIQALVAQVSTFLSVDTAGMVTAYLL